jgi:peptidyl-prolyl cis-trans isomerase C
MKLSRWALAAAPLAIAACGFGSAMSSHTDVVAKADNPEVVRALADLWVDYTLLATAAAEDSTLKVLDIDAFAQQEREDQTVFRYLESTIRTDTSLTDAELEQLWNTEGPGVEVKARHILLMPAGAANAQAGTPAPEPTPAQRQELRQRAEAIRARAAAGEDFAALAAQTTEEPGGKERGGDLGWFGRGRMVAQFEEAALKLQPGQISPVVETPFGYHVIKVEDRRQTPLGENRAQFREQAQQQVRQKAFGAYVDSIKKASNLQVRPDAVAQMKELAAREELSLRGRAAARELVTFTGGEFNAGELAEVLQGFAAREREGIKDAQETELKSFLENQALRDVLLNEAKKANYTLSAAAADSINRDARQAVRQLLEMAGLNNRQFPKGKAGNGAIQEAVRNLMEETVAGQRRLAPLGKLSYALRNAYEADVNEATFQKVVDRMKAIRAANPAPQPGQQMPGGMPQGGMPQGMPQQGVPPQPQPQQGQQQPEAAPAQPQAAPAQPAPAPQGQPQTP